MSKLRSVVWTASVDHWNNRNITPVWVISTLDTYDQVTREFIEKRSSETPSV